MFTSGGSCRGFLPSQAHYWPRLHGRGGSPPSQNFRVLAVRAASQGVASDFTRVAVGITRSGDTAMRELLAVAQVCLTAMLLAGDLMLFWPIVIALGPGFVALYYDHDVKSFADQSMCEQTVSILEERARRAKELVSALSEAAGDQLRQVTL
jgi:hypothetical protein